jgi:hypothetical protein
MRMLQTKVVEKIKTHFVYSNLFQKTCRLWDNVENTIERGRPQMTIWRMLISCWIPKATNIHTHPGCVLWHCNNGLWTRLYVTLHVRCLSRHIPVTISKKMHTQCYKLQSSVQVTKPSITSRCEYTHNTHLAPTRMSYERKIFWRTGIVKKKTHLTTNNRHYKF